jgi:hypothetical protein
MRRIIYASEVSLDTGEALRELRAIHHASVTNNTENGVTGALLFSDMYFLQVLEGDDDAVRETVARILQDDRHRNMSVLASDAIDERAFGQWSMKLVQRDRRTEPAFHQLGLISVFSPHQLTGTTALALLKSLAERST